MTGRANWRTPAANRTEVNENADRIAWLRERRAGVGGTDAAALMGVHVTTTMSSAEDVTAATIYLDKVSTDEPTEDDKPIYAFGHLMEPALLVNAEDRWGITTRPGGFYRHKDEPWRYANPDALSSDGGIVECKTASNRGESGSKWQAGEVSPHAFIQTQHYLAVTGRSHSYYSVAIRNDWTAWESVPRDLWGTPWFHQLAVKEFLQVGPVQRDEAVIAHLLDIEREFWSYVEAGIMPEHLAHTLPPALRWRVGRKDIAVAAAIPEMVTDDIARLRSIKERQAVLDAERDAIEQSLKGQIGDAEYLTVSTDPATEGVRVARWSSYLSSSFDKRRFTADHPDLAAAYTTRKPSRRFTLLEDS